MGGWQLHSRKVQLQCAVRTLVVSFMSLLKNKTCKRGEDGIGKSRWPRERSKVLLTTVSCIQDAVSCH